MRDAVAELRRAAAARYESWLGGAVDCAPPGFLPTRFQARRFNVMLDILDLLHGRAGGRITTHEIARRVIYPRMSIARGAEWKSSSERRRTQRLIAEARGLMNGGYRNLLRGSVGRQRLN